ncbi:MAG: NADPH dehydrogenase [Syntrophus sp. PtaB.Bin138]|nr:MAG: NADPH dehydrogenase [Syntrophus sp. PtaB.Bin138]
MASILFSPFKLRGIEFKNRIFMPPMDMFCSDDGFPSDWHFVHYGTRAMGGAALLIQEATAVSPEGRISPGCLGIWSDGHADAFKRITAFIRNQGAVPGVQLAHAGRKASVALPSFGDRPLTEEEGAWQIIGPSPIPFTNEYPVPKELSAGEMDKVVAQFAAAAKRALSAGFEVVEIHMAHGYLCHQFLSPLSNKRTDEYGGSLENRARFPLRVASAIRDAWPDNLPVFVRVSATDWVEGGWDLPQTVQLARMLKGIGIDLIDCSTGGLVADARIPAGPGFQTAFAATVRKEAEIPTAAVGLIMNSYQAEQIVRTGIADAVLIGRELLRNPYWPLQAARELGFDMKWQTQYLRGKPQK